MICCTWWIALNANSSPVMTRIECLDSILCYSVFMYHDDSLGLATPIRQVEVDSIDPEITRKLQEDVVLLARRATGDEEVRGNYIRRETTVLRMMATKLLLTRSFLPPFISAPRNRF